MCPPTQNEAGKTILAFEGDMGLYLITVGTTSHKDSGKSVNDYFYLI